jgi:translation initiation factor IF-2
MSEEKMMRLGQIARKLNVGTATIVESMAKKGYEVENNPNSKITLDQVSMLEKEFKSSALEKEEASHLSIGKRHEPVASEQDLPKQEKVVEPTPVPTPVQEPQVTPAPVAKAPEPVVEKITSEAPKLEGIRVLGKVDLSKKPAPTPSAPQPKPAPAAPKQEEKKPEPVAPVAPKAPVAPAPPAAPTPVPAPKVVETPSPVVAVVPEELISAKADSLKGLTVLGKIELPTDRTKKKGGPVASSDERGKDKKRPRKRIDSKPGAPTPAGQAPGAQNRPQDQRGGRPGQPPRPGQPSRPGQPRPAGGSPQQRIQKAEPTPKEIQDQIKQTLARLQGNKPGGKTKSRRDKRAERDRDVETDGDEVKILKVTEFISANDLAALLDVSVNQIISACLSLGMFVSINQRLDAEAITIIADEFGFDVEFTKSIEDEMEEEVPDTEEELLERAPIVTIMGHVDHGKTSLLDFIRMSKVTAAEAGGITQHIGAYDVRTKAGNKIAFLDTPGHEAFTAMRARGAKITDVAIIVIAADDSIMPQTKEAINHAQVAGVPMIFAINKVDKPNARPEKIKEELANMNLLVEDWGGKYQSQEISAKTGQ